MAIKMPNGRNIDKMAINIPTFSIARPFQIYPSGIFGLKINHLATLERTGPKGSCCETDSTLVR
jgi:hypothetical protein